MGVVYLIILTCAVFSQGIKAQILEGAACKTSTNGTGVCKIISKCPSAIYDIRNKIRLPSLCSFSQGVPIVCCEVTAPVSQAQLVCDSRSKRDAGSVLVVHPIIGGTINKEGQSPHMAAIGFRNRQKNRIEWRCGGTLISKRFVLTAAHCLEDKTTGRWNPSRWVRLGDLDLATNTDDANTQQYGIAKRIPHPEYEYPMKYNDIGLLQLQSDVLYTDFVKPACLHATHDIDETKAEVVGWGYTGEVTTSKDKDKALRTAAINLLPIATCTEVVDRLDSYVRSGRLEEGLKDDDMICAGELAGGKDSCRGDSGGPLQIPVNSSRCSHEVVGIVSFGINGCAKKDVPAVYTRVSKYLPWIQSIVCT